MNIYITVIFLLLSLSNSCSLINKDSSEIEIEGYKIGNKVDTTNFDKIGDLYFPNYLDGWTMENSTQLPEMYKNYPITIWQLKNDSAVALTLLNDIVLKITVSFLKDNEMERYSQIFTEYFGKNGQNKSYEENHPLQAWITYWNLTTWESKDAIAQIGNSDMRKPDDPETNLEYWNLVYTNLKLEKDLLNAYEQEFGELPPLNRNK